MKLLHTLSLTLLASTCASLSYADPVTVYGKANISAQAADEGEGNFTELKSNASRFGLKGDLALDNNIEVLYLFEWQVDLTDEAGADNISARNQYVGLKGDFGTVLLGRNDTMLKQSQGKIDLFNDYEADLKGLWKGENRMGDSLSYYSPSLAGFTLGMSYIAKDEVEGVDGQSVSLSYGDVNLKEDQWFASVAADFDLKGYDTLRASLQTKLNAWTLGAILHRQKSVQDGEVQEGALISASYSIGKLALNGQYQTLEDDGSASVGADYKLGKDTKAFIWYTDRDLDSDEDQSWLALGLEHKF